MSFFRAVCASAVTAFLISGTSLSADPVIKNGDKLAFMGDSITQQGNQNPHGYVKLVMKGLEVNGIKAEAVPAGISGHKSNDMLARLENDVLKKQPQIMTLSCGVNDVWHGSRGVPLDQYKENITKIVSLAQAANIKVIILTATMIGEDQKNANNQKLAAYNEFLKQLAKEKNCPLADLNADMQTALTEAVAKFPKPAGGNYLTTDGVHMGPLGNMMMAEGVLEALGLDKEQIAKAKKAWLEMPNGCEIAITVKAPITIGQYVKYMEMPAEPKNALNNDINKRISDFAASLPKN